MKIINEMTLLYIIVNYLATMSQETRILDRITELDHVNK